MPSIGPRQPSRNPRIECPCWSTPLRTTARITAFRPGQSPPPVSTPIRIRRATYLRDGRRGGRARALAAAACAASALGACACGDGEPSRAPSRGALTVYTSLPRAGVESRAADAVAAGERLALADAHGRAAGRAVRLVELDSAAPNREPWDPAAVEANARRAARDTTAVAYVGELGLGASPVSGPVTSGAGMLQVSPADGLTSLTRPDPAEPEAVPAPYY